MLRRGLLLEIDVPSWDDRVLMRAGLLREPHPCNGSDGHGTHGAPLAPAALNGPRFSASQHCFYVRSDRLPRKRTKYGHGAPHVVATRLRCPLNLSSRGRGVTTLVVGRRPSAGCGQLCIDSMPHLAEPSWQLFYPIARPLTPQHMQQRGMLLEGRDGDDRGIWMHLHRWPVHPPQETRYRAERASGGDTGRDKRTTKRESGNRLALRPLSRTFVDVLFVFPAHTHRRCACQGPTESPDVCSRKWFSSH